MDAPTGGEARQADGDRPDLRALGLRPLTIWVPDTGAAGFAAEARAQSLAVARSASAADDQGFIDAVSDFSGE
ncbi:antitoxin MazE-like protein [Methylobacterium sp. A54F]